MIRHHGRATFLNFWMESKGETQFSSGLHSGSGRGGLTIDVECVRGTVW
jgi:hypothetical protein